MSTRAEDLAAADKRIEALQARANQIQAEFGTYNDQVTESITGILKDAGCWDEVHELDQERNKARQEMQGQLAALQREANALAQAKRFLLIREQEDQVEAAPKEATVASDEDALKIDEAPEAAPEMEEQAPADEDAEEVEDAEDAEDAEADKAPAPPPAPPVAAPKGKGEDSSKKNRPKPPSFR
jgi:hypothetical protein